jgi:hypothetical protein
LCTDYGFPHLSEGSVVPTLCQGSMDSPTGGHGEECLPFVHLGEAGLLAPPAE